MKPSAAVASVAFAASLAIPVGLPTHATLASAASTSTSCAPATSAIDVSLVEQNNTAPMPILTATKAAGYLTIADAVLHCSGSSTTDIAAAGLRQEIALQNLAIDPTLRVTVLAKLAPRLRPFVSTQVDVTAEMWKLTKPKTFLPAWRIVAARPLPELQVIYEREGKRTGIGWQYLAAINFTETKFGRVRGASSTGALGPMQFMPRTWKAYGHGDVENESNAIAAAADYLLDTGAPTNMRKALYAYNHLNAYVDLVETVARAMADDPSQLRAYYGYRALWRTPQGVLMLNDGYTSAAPPTVPPTTLRAKATP